MAKITKGNKTLHKTKAPKLAKGMKPNTSGRRPNMGVDPQIGTYADETPRKMP